MAVGAHPDDIEFGCGGTIRHLCSRSSTVRAVILTRGEAGANAHNRVEEAEEALRCLGASQVVVHDFPDTQLTTQLDRVIRVLDGHINGWDPDFVFTMNPYDHHQDHRATFQATLAAARGRATILSYETPMSPPEFCPTAFFDISPHLKAKIRAMRRHNSQNHKSYLRKEHIMHRAYLRGLQARIQPTSGLVAAEGFEVVRLRLSELI